MRLLFFRKTFFNSLKRLNIGHRCISKVQWGIRLTQSTLLCGVDKQSWFKSDAFVRANFVIAFLFPSFFSFSSSSSSLSFWIKKLRKVCDRLGWTRWQESKLKRYINLKTLHHLHFADQLLLFPSPVTRLTQEDKCLSSCSEGYHIQNGTSQCVPCGELCPKSKFSTPWVGCKVYSKDPHLDLFSIPKCKGCTKFKTTIFLKNFF